MNPFSFLIGHKVVILSIPKDIERYKQAQEKSKTINDLDALKPNLIKKLKIHMQKKKLFFPTTLNDMTNLLRQQRRQMCC